MTPTWDSSPNVSPELQILLCRYLPGDPQPPLNSKTCPEVTCAFPSCPPPYISRRGHWFLLLTRQKPESSLNTHVPSSPCAGLPDPDCGLRSISSASLSPHPSCPRPDQGLLVSRGPWRELPNPSPEHGSLPLITHIATRWLPRNHGGRTLTLGCHTELL